LAEQEIQRNSTFLKYEDNAKRDAVKAGGGSAAIKKLHSKEKLTARKRIHELIDPGVLQT
jgi:acetyl-CoA carboxylase carboxyltransferase component